MPNDSYQATLLYVEEDANARHRFQKAVQDANARFPFRIAASVQEATDCLSGPRYLLPAFPAVLAGGAVSGLLKWICDRIDREDTEVAVLGPSNAPEQAAEYYRQGADYYLVKPSEYSGLLEVTRAIDRGFSEGRKQCFYRLVRLPEYCPPFPLRSSLAEQLHRRRAGGTRPEALRAGESPTCAT
jgi:DNA-binding NtrC family response regulator